MLPQQIISQEVNANFLPNRNKIVESKNQLQDFQIRVILMAIEIERLHQVLKSKINYQNEKEQNFNKRGQNSQQNIDLIQKRQIDEFLQANNQQKVEKNEFINKSIKENSQLDINMEITNQCANFEQELKSQLLQNQQLQQEIQELRSQIKDAPSLRKKLYDLEQLYSQLLIEKNEELKQLTQQIPQTSFQDSKEELNALLKQKQTEQQKASEQTNLIFENKELTKEIKFLNLKLNLLLNDNTQLREKLSSIQSQNTFKNILKNKTIVKNDSQESLTPKRQQQYYLLHKINQLGNNKTIERIYEVKSNSPICWKSNSQIPYQQSYSQPQQIRENQNIYQQFNDLIKQILFLQNQKFQTTQGIKSQIFYLKKILKLKEFEINNQINLNNHLINQQLSTSTNIMNYPYSKYVQYSFSLSPNKFNPQSYQFLQPSIRNLHPQSYQRIKTEKSFVSYLNISQILPKFLQKPQNQFCYQQGIPKQYIHYPYSHSPIKKTIVKQNINNPYYISDINPKQNASYYKPSQISTKKQENLPNIKILKNQEENNNKEVILPEFNINTTEFQIKSQNSMQNKKSQRSTKQNFTNEDDKIDEPKQDQCNLDRKPLEHFSRLNESGTFQQQPLDIPKKVQIFEKINLQNPFKQKSQAESEHNKRQQENNEQNDNLNLTQKQSKDFKLSHEKEFLQIYHRALNLLENVKDLFQIQFAESEINQQIKIQRNNKFNRTINDNIGISDKQQEHQYQKMEQTFSNLNQNDKQIQNFMTNDFLQQIIQLKNLLNQQQIHLSQFISEQDEIKNKYETLLSQSSQTEEELNKEAIKLKKDHENINISLTQKLYVQSQEINLLEKQNAFLKQQILDCTKEMKDLQQELKIQHDQYQKSISLAQALQLEDDNNKNQIFMIQNRNKHLEQQIIEKDKLLFENQKNTIQKQTHDSESQTILKDNQQMQIQFLQQDQIEIENQKKQLSFEQELTNQLYDSISVLQQQIQAQEQLLQIQKLNNQNQFEEIQNLTLEKAEIFQQLKTIQAKYLELQEQIQLIQNQNRQVIQQNFEPQQNNEVIQNLNFQLQDMKQLNQFLQNQLSQIQQNSEIQISAQSTVLSSKIALLEKQLSFEKQLKEQANIKIKQLEVDYQNQKNHLQQVQTSELKEKFQQISNQEELKLTKINQDQAPTLDLLELKNQIAELNFQNLNYLKQIKDFEQKQQTYLEYEKKITNQTKLLQQYQQQAVILEQENNQYKNDVLKLRQGLQLNIQDFENQQCDYINKLKTQIEELQSQNMNLKEDINYLQSQLQFEQREKNIIVQNKSIQDGAMEQIREKNVQLQNQILQQQNYIDLLKKKIQQSNYSDDLLNQTESLNHQRLRESKNLTKDDNQINSFKLDISSLRQQNKVLVEECSQLKVALQEISKEKEKLQKIMNYQNQEQENCFQDLYQSQTIINNSKNEQQIYNKQIHEINQQDDLNTIITISLEEIDQLCKLNFQNEQINQDVQNQIKNLKELIKQIQEVEKIQIEEDKQNEFIVELTQIVQILNQRIKDKIQLNSIITKIIFKVNQLLVQINEITAQTLQRGGNNNLQQNYFPLKSENEENLQELKTENYKLNQKVSQYEKLLQQLQDEYYKQGSALQSLTQQYQEIINQSEFQIIRITQLKQLNERINQQEKQIEELFQQNLNLQKYIEEKKKINSDEVIRLNNIIQENQVKQKNDDQISQENIKLQTEIVHLKSEQEKQRCLEDLIEGQKLQNKQNQDEQTQLKLEIQRLYQRLLQISNSFNLLKEEKEQELLRFEGERRLIEENLEKIQNENQQQKVLIGKLQRQIQDQKNQTENNFQEEIKKLQIQLEISHQQQRSIQDEKRIAQAQVYQQLEQLANQLNTISLLRQEVNKQEKIIDQLSQQKDIKSSFVQEVTLINDLKSSKTLEFQNKLQNENSHLQQLLKDMENYYTHKIKMQEIQIEGLNEKLRDMLYEQCKKDPKVDDVVINNFYPN